MSVLRRSQRLLKETKPCFLYRTSWQCCVLYVYCTCTVPARILYYSVLYVCNTCTVERPSNHLIQATLSRRFVVTCTSSCQIVMATEAPKKKRKVLEEDEYIQVNRYNSIIILHYFAYILSLFSELHAIIKFPLT